MRCLGLAALGVAAVAAAGCSSMLPHGLAANAPVPGGPDKTAEVTSPPVPAQAAPPAIPENLLKPGATFTLADIVEIALQNNPLTRTSYLQARSAAADLGSKRAAYYPTVDLSATATRSKQSVLGGQYSYLQNTYGPAVTLSYLILDLGGRSAKADEARFALLAADWTHNATIQNVILAVQQTFVQYLNAKAQLEAAKATVKEARTALDAATTRHHSGVATIAEVLQAKTALSQAQLNAETYSGQVLALRGSLATAMGLPANTPYDVGDLPADLPLEPASKAVDALIGTAEASRPDLAAARVLAEKANAHIRSVHADGQPTLSALASANRTYYDPSPYAKYGDSWSAGVVLTVPLFTGYATTYNTAKAREDAAVAKAQADTLEQQVILQVWTSYYGLQTARQLVTTSRDLLESAEESERVALGRYKEGVGTIIDLLTAQSALSSARAEEILARSSWFDALAQLAHDTGVVSPTLAVNVPVSEEQRTP
jgi:outer membrane protein